MVAGELRPATKSAESIEDSLAKIVADIERLLNPKEDSDATIATRSSDSWRFAEKGQLAQILEAVGKLEKSLPRSRTLTFRFTWNELLVLLVYAIGGLAFLWLATQTANVAWTSESLVNILAYWTAIVAVVLGSQAIPKIIRSSL